MMDRDQISVGAGICVASPFFSHGRPCHPCGEQQRIEIEVGELVSFAVARVLETRWALVRKPAVSAASLGDGCLYSVDRPGVYVVRATARGLWIRELELCAFTEKQMYGAGVAPSEQRRLQQRCWLNDPTTTTEMVIRELEIKQ